MAFDYVNYDELDYIETDGLAYIDTGYLPNRSTAVEGRFWYPSNSGFFFGVNDNDGTTGYYDLAPQVNNIRYVSRLITNTVIDINGLLGGITDVYCNPKTEIVISDSTQTLRKIVFIDSTITCNRPLYVLARNNKGNPTYVNVGNRLYYFKITNTFRHEVVHEYIPAKRKSDDRVGVYDTISETFITPPIGTFRYGSVIGDNVIKIKNNDVWLEGKPYFKVDYVWKRCVPYVKINGQWKEVIK